MITNRPYLFFLISCYYLRGVWSDEMSWDMNSTRCLGDQLHMSSTFYTMSTNNALSPHHHRCLVAHLRQPTSSTTFNDQLRQPPPVANSDVQLHQPTLATTFHIQLRQPPLMSNFGDHLWQPPLETTTCGQLRRLSNNATPPTMMTIILNYDYYKSALCWQMSFLFCWRSWHKIVNKTII